MQGWGVGAGCQPGLTCKAVLPKRFRASGCTSSRCRRRRTSCTSPRAAAPLNRSPTQTSSRSIVDNRWSVKPTQSQAQFRSGLGNQQELGQNTRGCGATRANSMVTLRPQTLRPLRVPPLSQPAPPPVTERGRGEPRPALWRPPLGPGLPRLTLPPVLARAGSALSRRWTGCWSRRSWARQARPGPA